MSFTPSDPADFTPSMGAYKTLQPFRYWCQKVLPLVYDDSLSYYELLCKVVDYLNKTMEDVETLHADVDNIDSAFGQLQNYVNANYTALVDYVNNYFDNLDVQEEINNKLDVMAEDGTLDELLLPYFNAYKEQINTIMTTQNATLTEQNEKIEVLKGRMDTFASLTEGSTTGDAELVDIRVGADGHIYPSAGDAVRAQIENLDDIKVNKDLMNFCSIQTTPASENIWNKDAAETGYVAKNGTVYTEAPYNTYKYVTDIEVLPDDVIRCYRVLPNLSIIAYSMPIVTAYDVSDNAVEVSGAAAVNTYTVPSDIVKLTITISGDYNNGVMVTKNNTEVPYKYIPYQTEFDSYIANEKFVKTATVGKVDKNGEKQVNARNCDFMYYSPNLLDDEDLIDGYYVNQDNGQLGPNVDYKVTDFIEIEGGYDYSFSSSVAKYYRFAWYDEDEAYITGTLTNSVTSYTDTAPDNAKYVRFSTNNWTNLQVQIEKGSSSTPFIKYGTAYLLPEYNTKVVSGDKYKKVYASITPANNFMYIPTDFKCSVMQNAIVSLNFDIDTFNTFEVGFVNEQLTKISKITVTDTSIEYTLPGGTTVSDNHGLTFADNVQISLLVDNTDKLKISLTTGGVTFNKVWVFRNNDLWIPYAEFTDTTTEAVLSWTFLNLDKKVWCFGDSYFAYSNTRWIYYLSQNGYQNNCLIDGYGGKNSAQALVSLKNLLKIGKPEVVLWCMGMNDGSDTTTPNASWLSAISELIGICEANSIKLVLSTVPTVPSVNNEQKNAYVRNSDYQYIDFAKAVGANALGEWYTGMLSSDNVHPDVKGGIALYNRAICDMPQLTIN